MAPYQLRNESLKRLRKAREAMLTLDYLLAMQRLPPKERREAALELSRVQIAIYELMSVQLADIRDSLLANEAELLAGISAMDKALAKLKNIERILAATSSFLGIVGRVLKIAGGL